MCVLCVEEEEVRSCLTHGCLTQWVVFHCAHSERQVGTERTSWEGGVVRSVVVVVVMESGDRTLLLEVVILSLNRT